VSPSLHSSTLTNWDAHIPQWGEGHWWSDTHSDCQGFWNPHGLRVGYRWVQVWVQIPVPATYKMSPRTSKTDRNWWRYGPNSRKYCLAHISVISGPFWLFLGSKTHRVAGKGPWGKGTGWGKKPQGYPWQSLDTPRDWHRFEKPVGKCCRLTWGRGTRVGVQVEFIQPLPNLYLPQWVDGLPCKFKLCSKQDQQPVACSFDLYHHPLLCSMASKPRK